MKTLVLHVSLGVETRTGILHPSGQPAESLTWILFAKVVCGIDRDFPGFKIKTEFLGNYANLRHDTSFASNKVDQSSKRWGCTREEPKFTENQPRKSEKSKPLASIRLIQSFEEERLTDSSMTVLTPAASTPSELKVDPVSDLRACGPAHRRG